MKTEQVEAICSNLSLLFLNTIRTKLIKELHTEYSFGEALLFWLADMLSGSQIVNQEQLRLLLEELQDNIKDFGKELEEAWQNNAGGRKSLPHCKIGFLDRHLVCMDGYKFFLDLKTGQKVPTSDTMPLETIVYSLTTLYVRYRQLLSKQKGA